MKANKEKIITDMLIELERGTERKQIISIFCKKFQRTPRTIDSFWKIAKERYKETSTRTQKAIEVESIANGLNRVKSALLTKSEKMEILANIAKGEIDRKVFIIDRIRAIAELNRMEGDYAPDKLETKTDLQISSKTDEAINRFLKKKESIKCKK